MHKYLPVVALLAACADDPLAGVLVLSDAALPPAVIVDMYVAPSSPPAAPDAPAAPGPDGPSDPGPDDPPSAEDPPADPPAEAGCEVGRVHGLACAPDGSPVAGARVAAETTDCDGNPVTARAEALADGSFSLDGLAPGPATVVVRAGSFEGRYEVVVRAGQAVSIDPEGAKECLPRDAARIAVTTGEFDSIEDVVSQLGFDQDVYCGDADGDYGARALLGRWELLSTYDVVFLNCGLTVRLDGPDGAAMVQNIRRFVREGGSIYASDLAAYVVEAAFPDAARFRGERAPIWDDDICCTCVNCPAECGASVDAPGFGGQCRGATRNGWCDAEPGVFGFGDVGRRPATIRNPQLQRFLGRDQMVVEFDLDGWVEIAGVGPGTEVLVDSVGEPLMILFQEGEGRVAYTTFHNEAQAARDVVDILRALVFQL